MRVWRLTDDAGQVIASVPMNQVLDPTEVSQGRTGYGVYEAVSGSGAILYTGRTKDLANRLRAHSTQAPRWGFATDIRWVPCDNYAEAVALERDGISTDRGDWNITQRGEIADHGRHHLPDCAVIRLRALYAASESAHGGMDFDNYVASLRCAGWTLQSIATPLNITRERIRQRALLGAVDHDLVVPRVPKKPERSRKFWPRLSDAQRDEMIKLQGLAERCRGGHSLNHPYRIASERLAEQMAEARLRGVRIREIAEALGVAEVTVMMRIRRHGYMKQAPSQDSYAGKQTRHGASTHCARGHELAGDNLRLVNGDPSRRICRTCERIRVAKYRSTRQQRSAA